ncbi:MAG: DUF2306 domain-containing protein [Silvibacterium sp.]
MPKLTNVRRSAKIAWFILALFSVVNALEALRYLLPHVPFPVEMENFRERRIALSLHALGGAVALLAGPLQFVPRFRESDWNRHRVLGWTYCGAVLLGWCASLWIAPHSQTGWIASAGFLTLGAAWIVATGLALGFILRGYANRHRRWMIRSFALTAAAVTLRMYLPLIFVFHWPFSTAYPAIAWLCWIPNVLAVEVYLRFVSTHARTIWSANLSGNSASLP